MRFKMTKPPTITIGIPAYNEQANIGHLLDSIILQSETNFALNRILVVCDGCTDETGGIARQKALLDHRIQVVDDKRRSGKLKRLEQIYAANRSDILLVLDADVFLPRRDFLQHIISGFDSFAVGLVGGHSQPVPGQSLAGKLLVGRSRVWQLIRTTYLHGNNVYNSRGCCLAMRKSFARSVHFPSDIASDSQYLYFLAIHNGWLFKFSSPAVVYYREPESLTDYSTQRTRSRSEKNLLTKYFGLEILSAYKIPVKFKIAAAFACLITSPFYTFVGVVFNFVFNYIYLPRQKFSSDGQIWHVANTTKQIIKL